MRSLEFLTGYEDYFNLGVTSRHISTVNAYVIQYLQHDLVMPSSFYVEESCTSLYPDIGRMDLTVATIYKG